MAMVQETKKGNIGRVIDELKERGLNVLDRKDFFTKNGIEQTLLLRYGEQNILLSVIHDIDSKKLIPQYKGARKTNTDNLDFLNNIGGLDRAHAGGDMYLHELDKETKKQLNENVYESFRKVFPKETVKF
ncbi:MAG: hypothetical protein ABIE55_03805 [Candidatus Aenigmatarchaeota archaeon]